MVVCIAVQSEALEHSLMAALPLGPQSAAGGVSLPDSFHGELTVIHVLLFLPLIYSLYDHRLHMYACTTSCFLSFICRFFSTFISLFS